MEAQVESLPVVSTRGLEGVLVAPQEPTMRLANHLTDTSEQQQPLMTVCMCLHLLTIHRNIHKHTGEVCSQDKTQCDPL